MTEVDGMENKIKLFAVCGPTASGKTGLSIALAKAFDGEVVSCDSMQIYKGMEIGTAKPTEEEMDGVPHHLLGFCDPAEVFSVVDFTTLAGKAIRDIAARGKKPFLVGGTGLYARSLLRAVPFTENSRDDAVRAALQAEFEKDGIDGIYARLQAVDPESAAQIHPNNTKRVIRAMEYYLTAGEPFSAQAKASKLVESDYDYVMLCLDFRDREKLYERINRRVDMMLEMGLLDEIRSLLSSGIPQKATAFQAIGYKEFIAYLNGEMTLEQAADDLKKSSRHYAKRQLTWFRRNKNIHWLTRNTGDPAEKIITLARQVIRECDN